MEFCRAYRFDGVDLDWEYPADTSRGGKAADNTNFGLLVQTIRAALDAAPDDLELSMAIPVPTPSLVLAELLPVVLFQCHNGWMCRRSRSHVILYH